MVVNNAGFGISGAIEFTKTEDAKRLFDADFFGMVNVNRAVIPHMRQAGAGRIVNLSSVAAAAPIPFQAYYSAAKAAVNSYTMALANELAALRRHGVRVRRGTTRLHRRTGKDHRRRRRVRRPHQPLRGPDGARRADGHGSGQGGGLHR